MSVFSRPHIHQSTLENSYFEFELTIFTVIMILWREEGSSKHYLLSRVVSLLQYSFQYKETAEKESEREPCVKCPSEEVQQVLGER